MTAPGSDPLFERLEVFDDFQPRNGGLNMALDEVLLEGLQDVPLLRIYRWSQPTVSFGFFDPWQAVGEDYPGAELVRRWTGGGVVEHGGDATYSLLVPRREPLTNGPAGESYRLIHFALRRALIEMGWGEATLSEAATVSAENVSRACFTKPVRYDLLAGDRKISGAAQRRTRWGLLHQGSVRRADGQAANAGALAQTLPNVLGRFVVPRLLHGTELAAARRLAADKYSTDGWLKKR